VFKGTHKVWTWRFYPDRAGAFASDQGPLGSLVATLDQVPIIKKLTETINIDKPVFELTDKSTNEVNEYLGLKFIQTVLKTGENLSEFDKMCYLFEIVDKKKFFLHKINYGL
jgi:hypothetical protein